MTGGSCLVAPNCADANRQLGELPAYRDAKKIVSLVDGLGDGNNVDLQAVADPHELEDVDFAILPGEFAVAENGAVWITGAKLPHRVVCFIPQHVAVALPIGGKPGDVFVDNMHQAYARLSFDDPEFGVFVSGPSKTADIEQSLVIGAHGPRSLTVIVVTSETGG
jgi:L-lactate dehydrogenase complex protein LldG